MGIMEIILLVLGIGIFAASFLVPEKKEKLHEADRRLGEAEIKELVEAQMPDVKTKIYEVVDETITYAVEKAERSMERVSNEKIMAVNEYSDTVLESIHKNHEEVVFLFDMLNDKHQTLRETAVEMDKKVKEVRDIVQESERTAQESAARMAEDSVRAVEESAREAWEAAREALQQVKDAEEDALRQVRDAAEESALLQARNVARNVREQTAAGQKYTLWQSGDESRYPLPPGGERGQQSYGNMRKEPEEEGLPKGRSGEDYTPDADKDDFVPRQDREPDGYALPPEPADDGGQPAAVSSFTPLQPVKLKEEGDKAGEEHTILKEEKRKEEKPRKRAPRKTKPVPAVDERQADMPPVAISFAANTGEDGRNNNEKILALHKEGKSNIAIARELGLGIGEVKLVIDLFKGV